MKPYHAYFYDYTFLMYKMVYNMEKFCFLKKLWRIVLMGKIWIKFFLVVGQNLKVLKKCKSGIDLVHIILRPRVKSGAQLDRRFITYDFFRCFWAIFTKMAKKHQKKRNYWTVDPI